MHDSEPTRLQQRASAAPLGTAVLDRELRYVEISETLAAYNGIAVADHLGCRVDEVLPELAPRLVPLLQQVLATGLPIEKIEFYGETPARPGTPRRWQASYFPIRARSGATMGVEVVVSELVAAAPAALAEDDKAWFDQALEAGDVGLFHWTPSTGQLVVTGLLRRIAPADPVSG